VTSPTKRMPLRVKVRTSCCAVPSSPSARRTALIRVVSADSDTIRPPHDDQFPPPKLGARCRFSQRTFAATRGNERDAP
jgi:hypothetical protein